MGLLSIVEHLSPLENLCPTSVLLSVCLRLIAHAAGSILRDVDLVWANCRAFNEPDSDICALADEAQQALRIRWQQAGLPTVTPAGPPHPPSAKKNKGRKRTLEEALPADSDQPVDKAGDESAPKKKKQKGREQEKGTQAESSSAEELKRALKAVKGVLKLKVATLFSAPVSEEDVPGYHNVVTEPMDLQTVSDKLQQQQYTSIGKLNSSPTSHLQLRGLDLIQNLLAQSVCV